MKIAFLGKGGSGKSTLATAAVRHLHSSGMHVLAIDADHNMDLTFNLGLGSLPVYLGDNPSLIKKFANPQGGTGSFVAERDIAVAQGVSFQLSPPDLYTQEVMHQVEPNLYVIAAGPHTDIVRSGEHCSHSLAAPLKIYVPLLQLSEDEAVVIDERAGTDPVATGILKGVDLAVIVAEPTVHSVRVAGQIAHELVLAEVPYIFVANKVREDMASFEKLPHKPVARVPFTLSPTLDDVMKVIIAYAKR